MNLSKKKKEVSDYLATVMEGTPVMGMLLPIINSPNMRVVIEDYLSKEVSDLSDDDIPLIKNIISAANYIYNNSGENLPMSDSEYDELYSLYKEYTGEDLIGSSVNTKNKVNHKFVSLRGTLDKIYKITDEDVLKNQSQRSLDDWISTTERKFYESTKRNINLKNQEVLCFPKFDGVSVIFECDKDGNLERALTRGDVTRNEAKDITHIFKDIFESPLKNMEHPYGLKSEVMMTESALNLINELYDTNYKQTRSAVSSIINSDTVDERVEYLEIIYLRYSILEDGKESLQWLAPNVYSYPYLRCKLGDTEEMRDFAHSIGYVNGLRCDGMVIYLSDPHVQEVLGREDNKMKYEVAYKFTEEVAYSPVVDIEFKVGLFGRVTPIVTFEPVKMKGNTVTKASLYSYKRFKDLELSKGDIIKITYDINPYADYDSDNPHCKRSGKKTIEIPLYCPYCHKELTQPDEDEALLYCSNPDCYCRVKGKILKYCKTMGIPEFGPSVIDDLSDAGVLNCIEDLYRIEENKKIINKLPGYGSRRIHKLIKSVDDHKEVMPSTFLGAIGIEGIGPNKMKAVLTMLRLDEVIQYSKENDPEVFLACKGIKEKTAKKIVEGINKNMDTINFLLNELLILPEVSEQGDFTVVFTKVRSKEKEDFIRNAGGIVAEAITKGTSLVVVPDINITSSKVKKAKEWGIPIVTIDNLENYISSNF